jgi:broad specificity phosphatase PhoE
LPTRNAENSSPLLLLRHAQSRWNAEGRWQGWSGVGLSRKGERQAREAALSLRVLDLHFSRLVSSDLRRAVETANVLADVLSIQDLELDEGLRERHVGEWTGLTEEEIGRRWPQAWSAWNLGALAAPPNGETDEQLLTRVRVALLRHAHRCGAEDAILCVGHQGPIRVLERQGGVDSAPVPHLAGRWLMVDRFNDRLMLGPRLELVQPWPASRTDSAT